MKRAIKIIFAVVVITMLVPTQYAKATQFDEVTQEIDYAAISGANEVQNNLDDGSRTNYDTWDPVPSGVWFGGWGIESRLRLSIVPDDDCSIALATVAKFGSDIIMSGAAKTIVRLPIHTSNDPWTRARLNIYEIDRSTNWTFKRDIHFNQLGDPTGAHDLNDMKINFTGTHELIFWSKDYDPTDVSPTDGDDHYTRSNRTFAIVDAPLKPDTLYLFVTFVWFPSDKYVEMYFQPDSLTDGEWNRSTVATYNEDAPDSYALQVSNFNVSLGYSFDFQNGFGNSAYGLNLYVYSGDIFSFNSYVDPTRIDDSHYLSFMLPYRSSTDNISWSGSIYMKRKDTHAFTEMMGFSNYMTNDFILISMEDVWSNNVTAQFDGWFRISLQINNDTRLWLPLWDIPKASGDMRMGLEWFTNSSGDEFNGIWETNARFNYNPMQYVWLDRTAGGDYSYHWMVQHSIQFNDYYWTKTAPKTGGGEALDETDNMTFAQKILYGIGTVLIVMGDTITPIHQGAGAALRAAGTAHHIIAEWEDFPDPFGFAWDLIQTAIAGIRAIGQWIWRAAQEVWGAIKWFVETVAYFASIILGIIIFGFAIIILFLSLWFSAKFAQMIVEGLRGRHDRAIALMGEVAGTATTMLPRK